MGEGKSMQQPLDCPAVLHREGEMAEEGMPCMPKVLQCTPAVVHGLGDQAEQRQWRPLPAAGAPHTLLGTSLQRLEASDFATGLLFTLHNWHHKASCRSSTNGSWIPIISGYSLVKLSASCQVPREALGCSLII